MLFKVLSIDIIRTFIINFNYFKFKDAIKFPIILGRGVSFKNLGGKIEILVPLKPGIVFIQRNILDINGRWVLRGETRLRGGTDSQVFIGKDGILETGCNLYSNGAVEINCVKHIKIGDNCLFAHKIEILDTDFHNIRPLD